MRLDTAEAEKQLSIAPSSASYAHFSMAASRLASPLSEGLPFQRLGGARQEVPLFRWPVGHEGQQVEEAGYGQAEEWLQRHVSPPGVQAVLAAKIKWLEL